jgi:cellulose synthase/poly-beta-1,6-N-acetylglucosamine synthase-like glycosyltransferase/peptidoglycan/xylan/chitin deacetylase (PgdA/CDA1 family)/spore germination protein YaaH
MKNAPVHNEQHSSLPSPATDQHESFIFLDTRGKRWPRFKRIMFVAGSLFFIAAVLFVQTLVLPSHLNLPTAVIQLKTRLKALQFATSPHQETATKPLWLNFSKGGKDSKLLPPALPVRPPLAAPVKTRPLVPRAVFAKEIRLGFYESGDPDSLDSLKKNAPNLTHLCPDWLTVRDGLGTLTNIFEQEVVTLSKEQGLLLLPLLRNLGDTDQWLPEAVEGLINGPQTRQDQFITNLENQLHQMGAAGVILDWQQVDPTYRDAMTAFITRITAALHADDMELWLCIPTGRELAIFDMDALAEQVDHFVAMLHDENAEDDDPGPIASRDYFNGWLDTLVENYGEPSQWVISLGSYGYDWTDGEKEVESIGFQDAMSRAGRSSQTSCECNGPSYNPHFVYEDGTTIHTVWFLDAVTFLNQLTLARTRHVGGIAITRLGTEDPGIWNALGLDTAKELDNTQLQPLETIRPADTIARIGKGNLITIADQPATGTRRIRIDRSIGAGVTATESYIHFPAYLSIIHQGRGAEDAVALSFDDGPDAEWTPQILDILKAKGVQATFFMVGANMETHPELVRRIVRDGHMIGVHTYSHPNIALVSEERAHLEFNATQRLIEAITGHTSILFRPPYNADTNPREAEELVPITLAQQMGYITVTEDIDPEDWDKPGVATIVSRVKEGRQQKGTIVLLHDAGGDRSQTVEALPAIIDYLRNRGDRIVSLPELVDIPAEQLMPPLPHDQQPLTRMISVSGFRAIHDAANFFWAFMIVATGLTVLKTLAVSWLAIGSRRADKPITSSLPCAPESCPPVSVLIAAYNEEKVIGTTLRAVLKTAYSGPLEVVVVDDGSTDATADIVATMARDDVRIRLLHQENQGKATALQHGIRALRYDIMVSLDADTQFTPETIGHLIRPFIDPAVAAVSGRARVGNAKTLFARFQSLEYTCGFNLDRRAYHRLNCITVVPGAVSAFRVSAIRDAGGISTDTLAEDTDLTLCLHKCGYTICYAPRAVAWTEAPETTRAFAKQRFRWAYGTLQCLWKHREMLFNPKYKSLGWFSLPSAWFFNIFLVAFGSIIDGILLLSLIVSPANSILYFYFFVFLAADLLLAAVACRIEREPLRQIWLVLPMRFIYRPVLNYVVIKVMYKALKGVLVGWGKLDRTASVTYRA